MLLSRARMMSVRGVGSLTRSVSLPLMARGKGGTLSGASSRFSSSSSSPSDNSNDVDRHVINPNDDIKDIKSDAAKMVESGVLHEGSDSQKGVEDKRETEQEKKKKKPLWSYIPGSIPDATPSEFRWWWDRLVICTVFAIAGSSTSQLRPVLSSVFHLEGFLFSHLSPSFFIIITSSHHHIITSSHHHIITSSHHQINTVL